MGEEKTNKTYLWKLLDKNIVIPIIQRDYAQGREENKNIRQSFLKSLKRHLENNEELSLDFVYGSVSSNEESFYPLDGQQRLTTLWLLHYYIALKSNSLSSATEKLLRFTYETRESSKEFCNCLVEKGEDLITEKEKPSYKIKEQLWFYKQWNYDPTIKAMLATLDDIDKLFKGCDYKAIYENLTSDNCLITFYSLKLKAFGLSDDLYIKMNARGKPLTSFENFKADFIDYINSKKIYEDIKYKIDNAWADVLWPYRSRASNTTDEIYSAFINRIFFNYLVLSKDEKELEKSEGFYLYGKESNDIRVSYTNFDCYNTILESCNIDIIKAIDSIFTNLKKIPQIESFIEACKSPYEKNEESSFYFIPQYVYDDNNKEISILNFSNKEVLKITNIQQMHRPVFFAVCKYLIENDKYDQKKFEEWMRVIWNICSTRNFNGISYMVSIIKKIDTLKSYDIYDNLTNTVEKELSSSKLDIRLKQECEKASIIKEDPKYENEIIEAEKLAFFNGDIKFLYTASNGNIEWDNFSTKKNNAKKYFNENGVEPSYKVLLPMNFIRGITDWWHQVNKIKLFTSKKEEWSYILYNKKYKDIVEKLLIKEIKGTTDISLSVIKDPNLKLWRNYLLEEKLIISLVDSLEQYRFRLYKDKYPALYPERSFSNPIVFDNATCYFRNQILKQLENKEVITVLSKHKKFSDKLYNGANIHFKYKDKNFEWYFYSKFYDIYLMTDENPSKYELRDANGNMNSDKNYYGFHITTDKSKASDNKIFFDKKNPESFNKVFISRLDTLIEEANK